MPSGGTVLIELSCDTLKVDNSNRMGGETGFLILTLKQSYRRQFGRGLTAPQPQPCCRLRAPQLRLPRAPPWMGHPQLWVPTLLGPQHPLSEEFPANISSKAPLF